MTLQRYRGSLHMVLPLTTASSDPLVAATRILDWVNADEHEAEVARLQAENERLREWIQYGDHLRSRAAASEIERLAAENARLRTGLEFVKKHLEVTVPDMCCVSATYRIACDALKGGDV